jgi:hypothetical protein
LIHDLNYLNFDVCWKKCYCKGCGWFGW